MPSSGDLQEPVPEETAGLSPDAAREALSVHGPNQLIDDGGRKLWRVILDQFRSVLILVLLAAGLIAGVVGDLKDALVILSVVSINAALGVRQEYRAERAMSALRGMLPQSAEVRRAGRVMTVPVEEIVPGDLVLLRTGSKVPADGRLVVATTLEVDESTLTGESVPVAKDLDAPRSNAPIAERTNSAFMNTVVTRGRGEMLVKTTGMKTEVGRVAGLLARAEVERTPLQVQLDSLGKRLAIVAGIVVALIFVAGLLRGQPLLTILLTSIALAVAAVPEGLPAVVSLTLANGMERMAKRGAIVKQLSAVETLGSTTVICSDKTGTLTLNQMTVRKIATGSSLYRVTGEGYHPEGDIEAEEGKAPVDASSLSRLMLPCILCNDSRVEDGELVGDPMEGALVVLAQKAGQDPVEIRKRYPRIAEIPIESSRKFMATFHRNGDGLYLCVKGAPDVLLQRCTRILEDGTELRLTEDRRHRLEVSLQAFASNGLRVLAICDRASVNVDSTDPEVLLRSVSELTLLGMVGLVDPPRPEARDAIDTCRKAGIDVKMITGDHVVTAQSVARSIGLEDKAMTGAELDEMDDERLSSTIEGISVFARVAPEHKVRLVAALKRRGHVVAMTGDGVNDAPALKSAHMGVAMGKNGTAVAKEAALMVLTDDNFATIVSAIGEGRTIYDNLVKFVRFQVATNLGAVLTFAIAPMVGLPTPFTAAQLLWINIIMDGPPAMALGLDPSRPGVMLEPPRRLDARLLSGRRLVQLAAQGTLMTIGTLGVLFYALNRYPSARAISLAFSTFVLFQVFNALNARTRNSSIFHRYTLTNGRLWLALGTVAVLQVLAVHLPYAQQVFDTQAISVADWVLCTGVASSILVFDELRKWWLRATGRHMPAG